jgi:glycosyltransferase involved in cell wall biosynthesis
MPIKVNATLLSPYPFHIINQAQQLSRLNSLERLVTAIPVSRTGLPSSKVKNRLYLSGLRYYARKALPSSDHILSRMVIKDFDRWATNELGSSNVVNALSGFATNTLRLAANKNVPICCDRGSWHILEQKRILDEESEALGCRPIYFDPFMVERELQEYEIADRIILPSEPAVQSFLRRGINPSKIAKVPYGVDIDLFKPPNANIERKGLVCVATVGLRKGHHILVDAFRSLNSSKNELTLVGPIDQEWIRRLDLNRGDIRITGTLNRSGLIKELQQASIFVLASLEEGLALVIAQAMACGLPIVATESTGASELINDGVEGFIVPSGDRKALAVAIDTLLSDTEMAKNMGIAACNRVKSLGGWETYGQNILNVFSALIQEKDENV